MKPLHQINPLEYLAALKVKKIVKSSHIILLVTLSVSFSGSVEVRLTVLLIFVTFAISRSSVPFHSFHNHVTRSLVSIINTVKDTDLKRSMHKLKLYRIFI